MIISRTPYRISFFGGGTDYPAWYKEHGGCVLATSINRYCYITGRYLPPFFEHKYRVVYSITEDIDAIEEIKHPAVRECLRFLSIPEGVEILHVGDLPKQTGLGTSSSFAVGVLHTLHALLGQMASPMQLTEEAIHVERDLCGDNIGSQDQVTAAHGGLNHIEFLAGNVIRVRPVIISRERRKLLQDHLVLFFTGQPRIASEIAADQIRNVPKKQSELLEMQEMVAQGIKILTDGSDMTDFGRLLHESWQLKRSLSSKISNEQIDTLYGKALAAGAIGGKLCGAGGGGFILLFAEPGKQPAVIEALKGYLHVPFEFESQGSQIIFFQPVPN
ncbi:kinase [Verrucomicrobiota bacterium]